MNKSVPVQLKWSGITYSVPREVKTEKKIPCARSEYEDFTILNNCSGCVEPGQMLAIMGPSGSGKTTLLNVLSGNISSKAFAGSVTVNGQPINKKLLRAVSALVPQFDFLFGAITVFESLMLYAKLKLPDRTEDEKKQLVDDLILELGLKKVRDDLVGYVGAEATNSGLKRGISGGERKRLAIAQQLLTDPPLLFLDEPTTGLDSFAAESVIRTLCNQARKGRTLVFTIHQPSPEVVAMFDNLLLLAHGNTIYFGPQDKAVKYFGTIGYKCPPDEDPADFYLDLIHREPAKKQEILQSDRSKRRRRLRYVR
eukprot:TRINITY_DN4750_c0_g1_i2.p2 TRINITY_DN4750_c0_g1~~TRINITY_DN4750_c0_g1_i2.p2  ORF type:complete len:311 (-),score=56.49 TRINITY_DN4750_c0_g1_i2:3068-4000(-)